MSGLLSLFPKKPLAWEKKNEKSRNERKRCYLRSESLRNNNRKCPTWPCICWKPALHSIQYVLVIRTNFPVIFRENITVNHTGSLAWTYAWRWRCILISFLITEAEIRWFFWLEKNKINLWFLCVWVELSVSSAVQEKWHSIPSSYSLQKGKSFLRNMWLRTLK